MNKRAGFTLIELLVVITIIVLLVGIIFSVGGNIIQKAQIKNTQGTMFALISACEQYRAQFYMYPDIDRPPTGYPGSSSAVITQGGSNTYDDGDCKEFNKRLRFMLEEKVYLMGETRYGPFVNQNLPKVKDESEAVDANKEMYADAWGNPLYVCMGRNHTGDNPKGPKNYPGIDSSGKDELGIVTFLPTDTKRAMYPPDIFSLGPNGVLNMGNGNSETVTTFDTTAADMDDVVSWLLATKYVETKNK
jgi:prepilin-type N-terminal cleavage/methylation domain-containing protein